MSILTWVITIYVAVGVSIMMGPLVWVWEADELDPVVKIIGTIISILVWPMIFFM